MFPVLKILMPIVQLPDVERAGATTTTTDNDKERWIHECITTPILRQQRDQSSLKPGGHRLKQPHGGGGEGGKGAGQTLPLDAGSATPDVGGHVHDVDVVGAGHVDEEIVNRMIGDAPTPLDVFTGSLFGTSPPLLPHPSQKKRRKRQLSASASPIAAVRRRIAVAVVSHRPHCGRGRDRRHGVHDRQRMDRDRGSGRQRGLG
jgi:hypothetical protein